MQNQSNIWAISPLDGRYGNTLAGLGDLVSEGALISYRLKVEAEWLKHLSSHPEIRPFFRDTAWVSRLDQLLADREGAANAVKAYEKETNHDVKACEYYLRDLGRKCGAQEEDLAWIHFACTSEDINNLSYGLMTRDLRDKRILPLMTEVNDFLTGLTASEAGLAMLSRTHGQTASPSTLGKEFGVFAFRFLRQMERIRTTPILGKMNGAVGNYNAHLSAFSGLDWQDIAKSFITDKLGLDFNPYTTQIENHDSFVEFLHGLQSYNAIGIDLCRDVWGYISLGYFTQKTKAGEVGSSTMPHKVNPIDFENAEGNFGLASGMAEHLAQKLPISRWQRDLSDSTVFRSLGTVGGYVELALRSLLKGLNKLQVGSEKISQDLAASVEVLAEPIQTVMRRYGVMDAYERLKAATRGQAVTLEALHDLIDACAELPADEKARLKNLTPGDYTGDARRLALQFANEWESARTKYASQ